jgi:hypothetical protein
MPKIHIDIEDANMTQVMGVLEALGRGVAYWRTGEEAAAQAQAAQRERSNGPAFVPPEPRLAPPVVQPMGPTNEPFVEPRMVEIVPGVAQIMSAPTQVGTLATPSVIAKPVPVTSPVMSAAKAAEFRAVTAHAVTPSVEVAKPVPDAPKVVAPDADDGDEVEVDLAVVKAKKRPRDVITYLISLGVKDEDTLVAHMRELTKSVPMLAKVIDIAAETRRVAAVQLAAG